MIQPVKVLNQNTATNSSVVNKDANNRYSTSNNNSGKKQFFPQINQNQNQQEAQTKTSSNNKKRNTVIQNSNQKTIQNNNNNNESKINTIQEKVVTQSTQQQQQSITYQEVNSKFFSTYEFSKISPKDRKSEPILQKILIYKDFLNILNISNRLFISLKPQQTQNYKAYVNKGNNGTLVKGILQRNRWWWNIVMADDKDLDSINLYWSQGRKKEYFNVMKIHEQVLKNRVPPVKKSKKRESQKNIKQIQPSSETDIQEKTVDKQQNNNQKLVLQKKKSNKQSKYLLQYNQVLNQRDSQNLENYRQKNYVKSMYPTLRAGFQFDYEQDELIDVLPDEDIESENDEQLKQQNELNNQQKQQNQEKKSNFKETLDPFELKMHNHVSNNYHLSNKKALFYNMKNFYPLIDKDPFDYIPLTFHIKKGVEDPVYDEFQERFLEQQQQQKNKKGSKNIWIIKPGESSNRGVGIQVSDDLNTIKGLIDNKKMKDRTYIVQKYLDRPLLYNKRKFDIRCYMLITCYNGITKAYWYQEGYIRTSSKEYSTKNLDNRSVHLTNDAIQKKLDDYGKFENGNKISYTDFQKYLDSQSLNLNFNNDIYPQMKEISLNSVQAVYSKCHQNNKAFSFELFGLDYMIDENFKVWLIEVNCNPDLATGAPLLARIIPQLVDNVFKIAVDPIFPPPYWPKTKKQLIPDNLYQNNKFELIFDSQYDVEILKNKYQLFKESLQEDQVNQIDQDEQILDEQDSEIMEEDEEDEQDKQLNDKKDEAVKILEKIQESELNENQENLEKQKTDDNNAIIDSDLKEYGN